MTTLDVRVRRGVPPFRGRARTAPGPAPGAG